MIKGRQGDYDGRLHGIGSARLLGGEAAGFEAWKREFAEEARAKGVSGSSIAALMQTNYATVTIAADRGQRSFGLSLDQFLAKRCSACSGERGRDLSDLVTRRLNGDGLGHPAYLRPGWQGTSCGEAKGLHHG
jgi:hypothetical protein